MSPQPVFGGPASAVATRALAGRASAIGGAVLTLIVVAGGSFGGTSLATPLTVLVALAVGGLAIAAQVTGKARLDLATAGGAAVLAGAVMDRYYVGGGHIVMGILAFAALLASATLLALAVLHVQDVPGARIGAPAGVRAHAGAQAGPAVTETPAAWYADPADPGLVRYWDGRSWTEQTAPAG